MKLGFSQSVTLLKIDGFYCPPTLPSDFVSDLVCGKKKPLKFDQIHPMTEEMVEATFINSTKIQAAILSSLVFSMYIPDQVM